MQYPDWLFRALPRLLSGFLLFAVIPAHAGQWSYLSIDGKMHALPYNLEKSNIQHKGGGLQYDFGGVYESWIPFVSVSEFTDSNLDQSYFAGGGLLKRFMISKNLENLHVDMGLLGGVMSRNDDNAGRPYMETLPMMSIGTNMVSLNITYIPETRSEKSELWLLQFKFAKKTFW